MTLRLNVFVKKIRRGVGPSFCFSSIEKLRVREWQWDGLFELYFDECQVLSDVVDQERRRPWWYL